MAHLLRCVRAGGVTHKVDDYVPLESIAEVNRQLSNKDHRFRIIGVNVKDGGLHHFGNIGAIFC